MTELFESEKADALAGLPWLQAPAAELFARVQSEQLPHALLINAAEGFGKSIFADNVAQGVLCQTPTDAGACGTCKSCSLFTSGHHPDYFCLEVAEGKQFIAVDQVREMIAKLTETSHQSGWRVAVINAVDDLNSSSFNALLKTLEEPGDSTLLLLLAHRLERVPPTIRSRCQQLRLGISEQELVNWLVSDSQLQPDEAEVIASSNRLSPLTLKAALESGDLSQRQAFFDALLALAQGETTPAEVASEFSDHADSALLWFQEYLLLNLQQRLGNPVAAIGLLPDAKLPEAIVCKDFLSKIIDLRRLQLNKAALNYHLQMQSLLIHWTQLVK